MHQLCLQDYDITRNYHQGNFESEMAHTSIKAGKEAVRNQIVRHIAKLGAQGATGDEVERALKMSHQTVSARLTEAKALKLVHKTGETRPTRSGRKAAVLVVLPF